ncbi:MAG: hypothetical protein ACYCO3_06565 [Mycobacteriales bacterium]
MPAARLRADSAAPGMVEALARAALAALPVALAGAAVTSEYVGAAVFSILTPALLGIACGAASTRAARVPAGSWRHRAVRAVAVLYALIGTGYGFRFVIGHPSPFSPAGQVLPPYLAAALGAWLWTWPPRRRQLPAGRATRK